MTNAMSGRPQSYELDYQRGNVGNLVHELIHAAVNEAYEQDFVNDPNLHPNPPPPDRVYDSGPTRSTTP